MSSTGEAVNPLVLIEQFGSGLAIFIREMNVGQDSEFTVEQFFVRYKSEPPTISATSSTARST